MTKSTAVRVKGYKATTPRELDHMISLCNDDKERGLLIIYAVAGFRLMENLRLNINDVQNEDGSIKDVVVMREAITKGHKRREVVLAEEAKEALLKVIQWLHKHSPRTKPTDPLWQTFVNTTYRVKGKEKRVYGWHRMSKFSWYHILWRIRPNADHATHSLRHHAARKTYLDTNDLSIVKSQLGHSSLDTTSIYLELSAEEIVQKFKHSIKRIFPINKLFTKKEESVIIPIN